MSAAHISRNYGIDEASEVFGVSSYTTRRRIKDESIRAIYIGARVLIPGEEVARVQREGIPRKRSEARGR
jgi:excisionase family DNA binding protein